jgi:hypothetical protein
MPQMTATVEPLIRLGDTIRLIAHRSDGCTVELRLTEDGTRGSTTRAVTSKDGTLVNVSVHSWPLGQEEPVAARETRKAIQIAQNGLAGAGAR